MTLPEEREWAKEFDEKFPAMGVSDHKSDSVYRHDSYKDGESEIKSFIATQIKLAEDGNKETLDKYQELIMAVENKYEGETRHETALRLIKVAQVGDARAASAPQLNTNRKEG